MPSAAALPVADVPPGQGSLPADPQPSPAVPKLGQLPASCQPSTASGSLVLDLHPVEASTLEEAFPGLRCLQAVSPLR